MESKLPVDLPGLDEKLKEEIERRISEYEEKYEPLVFQGRDAVVPRVKALDYIIAAIINAFIVVYLAFVMAGGS